MWPLAEKSGAGAEEGEGNVRPIFPGASSLRRRQDVVHPLLADYLSWSDVVWHKRVDQDCGHLIVSS